MLPGMIPVFTGGGVRWMAMNAALGTTTLSPTDKNAGILLSGGNLTATGNGAAAHKMVRATKGIGAQKIYWEATLSGVGVAGVVDVIGVQDGVQSTADGNYVGFTGHGFGWGYNTSAAGTYVVGQSSFTTIGLALANAVYGFAYDGTTGKFWVRNASGWVASGNPSTGANPTCVFNALQTMFPAISFYGSAASATYNFGASAFAFGVPT